MNLINHGISDVKVIEPDCFGDHRGWFMEVYNETKYKELGISEQFVQDNISFTKNKGTFRGLHFQNNPASQAKLVFCIQGSVLDICVDLRKNSPSYLQYEVLELSNENKRQFFIPEGFAHGFIALTDDVLFVYKVTHPYNKELDRSIRYDDPTINIDWETIMPHFKPILSEKDLNAPYLEQSDCNFMYGDHQ